MSKNKLSIDFNNTYDNTVKVLNYMIDNFNLTIEDVYDDFTSISLHGKDDEYNDILLDFRSEFLSIITENINSNVFIEIHNELFSFVKNNNLYKLENNNE